MDNTFLEHFYETVVLPSYADVSFKKITWKDHGKVGLDTWAHYFEDEDGTEFILLYEDFPGNEYINDNISHSVVTVGDEPALQISLSNNKKIDNIVGYFTLYKENY